VELQGNLFSRTSAFGAGSRNMYGQASRDMKCMVYNIKDINPKP
jgi:hypothetical protein